VVLAHLAEPVRAILADGTLYEYAARHARTTWQGRGPVYGIRLGDADAIVRHVRHGGALAPVTRDVFWGATRAPRELTAARQLRTQGIPTPEMLGYAVYPIALGFARADVVTREIENGHDLLALLGPGAPTGIERTDVWAAVSRLLESMTRAGALHPDLNVKNVVVVPAANGQCEAYVLDVDRVLWRRPGDPTVRAANEQRLRRSAMKQGLV
jgi:3-deoxy-D-manno-octulosonic acid kinase